MVTHIMSDGTKRNSIQGVIVPPGHPVYGILKAIFREDGNMEQQRRKRRKPLMIPDRQ